MTPLRSLPTHEKRIALTFDACQTRRPAGYDPRIVAILERTGTPATFFLGGRWIEAHLPIARALAAHPLFDIGSHSYQHPHFPSLTQRQAREDLEKAQEVHRRYLGRPATLFRPPYGEFDEKTLRLAAALGMETVLWSIASGDPDPKVSASAIVHEVLRRAHPGAIVIQHVNGRGWHSAQALPVLIQRLRARGYTFARIAAPSNATRLPRGSGQARVRATP